MSKIKNWRSFSFVLWIVLTVLALTTMPDMDRLVREKGDIALPQTEQSNVASQMIKEMNATGEDTYGIIAVFNSGSSKPLSSAQKEQIKSVIKTLDSERDKLGITSITSHIDNKEVEKQLVSEDQSTILTQISIDRKHAEISAIGPELNEVIHQTLDKNSGIQSYLTGGDLVSNDFGNSTQEGVKKTEVIAVIFILVVLILVFRSPVAPIISLITVGVSYLVSLAVIAHLVNSFDFPFSSFTQVFLVVVLFGVGTDYNILLYSRFKEELSRHDTSYLAVKATVKSAGKTVVFSGLAVLIGFASLFLAHFKLYQATSAVAIGVAVLLMVLLTLNPFFMALLGKRLFYPVKQFKGHGDSRLWGWLAKTSITRPIVAILFVIILSVPTMLRYTGNLNFNDLWEVSDSYESKQGINVIEEHFPPGFSSPATLVIQSDHPLDQATDLQTLDELTDKISKIQGVSEVYSPTRPIGDKIEELYINDQTKQLNDGLKDANSGINQIHDGLSSADQQMSGSNTGELDNVQVMINGTDELKLGVSQLKDALNQLTTGIQSGASGADDIRKGLATLDQNVILLSDSTSQLYAGYNQLEKGLSSYDTYFQNISQALTGAKQGYEQVEMLMNNLVTEKPELAEDNNIQQTLAITKSAQEQLQALSGQFEQLSAQHQTAMDSFRSANDSLSQVSAGMQQIHGGIQQLQDGTSNLKNGLDQGASGLKEISGKSTEMESGLSQINAGQKQLYEGLQDLQNQMGQLQSGLSDSTKGLDEVSTGLTDAQNYLSNLSNSKTSEKFYITDEALKGADFQKSLDTYMSDDRKIATLTIILDQNPYSREAMPTIETIVEQTHAALSGTDLSDAKFAIDGTTARNVDLESISQSDFTRTAIIMMIGIAIVLMVITRSFKNSIFIVASLLLVYFSSLGITELISTYLLGVDLLSWNVPFFSFIMIVALGVDYSIFLMMRYNELEGTSTERIVEASRHIGGVVLSAVLILGGTFAALIPSGVLTLMQVALVVIIGLVLLSFIAMPVLLPALIKLTSMKAIKEVVKEDDNKVSGTYL